MGIEKYGVTLEKEVVDEAREMMADRGSKLSPVINNLLKEWIKEMKKVEERDKLDG